MELFPHTSINQHISTSMGGPTPLNSDRTMILDGKGNRTIKLQWQLVTQTMLTQGS